MTQTVTPAPFSAEACHEPPLTRPEVAALAADLRTMLDRIEAGDLDASVSMRHRIEGAIAVLDVVQGRAKSFRLRRGSAHRVGRGRGL